MNNIIAVTIGDINGVGVDILLKLINKKKLKNIVLFSNIKIIKKYIVKCNLNIKLNEIKKNVDFKIGYLNIYSYSCKSNIENTLKSITIAHKECLKENYIGLVTLPINKELIIKKFYKNFLGHTEYLQKLEKKKYSNMILYHKKIIISPLTTHLKLKSVTKKIKSQYLFNQIINLNNSLKNDFNIKKPKIIISGINPHAGENGTIGLEEKKIIKPTINKLKKLNVSIYGPFSADTMILNQNLKIYDCFVFMYHDQALIPFKFISNFSGVNFTGNLEIIRTSPDHGTAYNLKGTNKISDKSLINCFNLVKKIYINRFKNVKKTKKIISSKFFN